MNENSILYYTIRVEYISYKYLFTVSLIPISAAKGWF